MKGWGYPVKLGTSRISTQTKSPRVTPRWPAVIYSRTLSQTGCPECYKLIAAERNRAGRHRSRQQRDQRAAAQIASVIPFDELGAEMPF